MSVTLDIDNGDRQVVVFVWSTDNGPCYECGLPAAFEANYYERKDYPKRDSDWEQLCCVCAANAAANGNEVRRIGGEPQ